jgi:glyoxylase-like metal-dependent hydrolase (beta-lactamase superfamily II)
MFPYTLSENLRVIGHPYFQLYLIKGTHASALVEVGITATAEAVIRQLSSLKTSPDYLIVTHPHSDHFCGLDILKWAYPHAAVIAGSGAAEFLDYPAVRKSMILEDRHMAVFMAQQGVASSRQAIDAAPSSSGWMTATDGEKLDLGGVGIRFLEAKGHAPGNILVHIESSDTILVSDSLGYHYPGHGFFPIFFTGYADYMATIDRIEALHPKIIGLAHHGFMQGPEVRDTIQKAKEDADRVMIRIAEDQREDEAIAHDLFRDYYRDEMSLYTRGNILLCCRLLVRRVMEYQGSCKNDKRLTR